MSNLAYLRKLGSGQFGEVWLAKELGLDALRAVKLVPKSSLGDISAYNEEARILYAIQHPNVVEVYATDFGPDEGDSPSVGMYEIVMEYMDRGSLEDSLKQREYSIISSIRIIADACRGLERVHSLNYLHRDIKPGNILMNERQTKLSDFGLSTLAFAGVGSGAGTFEYMAPEVIASGTCSATSDIYSLGVTLYEMVNGPKSLIFTGTDEALQRAILKGKFPSRQRYRPTVPTSLRRVINKAINADASGRYSLASDFRHAIESVRVLCDWRLIKSEDPEEWIGTFSSGLFKATISRSRLEFELSRCSSVGGTFRKVTNDCKRLKNSVDLEIHKDTVFLRLTKTGK